MKTRVLVFVVVVLCWSLRADAQISCTLSIVQTAVNAAADGATVQLQACTVNWPFALNMGAKKIHLKGAGVGQTVITSTNPNPPYLVAWGPAASATPGEISDITFHSGSPDQSGSGEAIYITGNANNVILRNLTIESHRMRGITFQGYIRGVVSGVTINNYTFSSPISFQHNNWLDSWSTDGRGHTSWASDSTIGTTEQIIVEDSTITGFCNGYCPGSDAYAGARFTLRFSKLTNAQWVHHGLDTPTPDRGAMHWEYYRNVLVNNIMSGVSMLPVRGGEGQLFDNYATVTGSGSGAVSDIWTQRASLHPLQVLFYRYADCRVRPVTSISCSAGTATVTTPSVSTGQTSHGMTADAWVTIAGSSIGAYNGTFKVTSPNHTFASDARQTFTTFQFAATCGGTASNGGITMASAFDGNTNTQGYACMDALGRGKGRLYTESGLTSSSFPGSANQISKPAFFFNNKHNGSVLAISPPSTLHTDPLSVVENLDYYNQNNTLCAQSAANCTQGIGRGTLAQRPSSCTDGVGWWATDQGSWNTETSQQHANHDPSSLSHTLGEDGVEYRCVSGAWQTYYTPPAYPHYLLTGGASNSPPSISISSHAGEVNTTASSASLVGSCSDDVGCPAPITYTCTPSCGSGSVTGTSSLTQTASLPVGVSTWTWSVTDAGGLTSTTSVRFYRVAAASTLPHTETFSIGSGVTWNNGYGSNWTRVGATQYGISNEQAAVTQAGFNGLLFTGVPLNANQYISATAIDVSPLSKQIRFCLSASGTPGQTSDFNGYFVQFDGSNSATNLIGRYDGGAFANNYTPGGLGNFTITNGATKVGAIKIGNTIQATVNDVPVGPLITTAGEYTNGTVGDCSVGVGTRLDSIEVGNASASADVDNPVVAIDTPSSDPAYHATASFTLAAAVSDNVGIVSCTLVNSQAGTTPLTPSGGRVTTDITITQGVQYMLTITCQDAAGLQGVDTLNVSTGAQVTPSRPSALRRVF